MPTRLLLLPLTALTSLTAFATLPSLAQTPPIKPPTVQPLVPASWAVVEPPASGILTGNLLAQRVRYAEPEKDGRVVVSNFTVAGPPSDGISSSHFQTGDNRAEDGVTLEAPRPIYKPEDVFSDPTLRDQVEVKLTPALVAQLNDLGIDDPRAHFKGRTLQVRGRRQANMYTGFPAFEIITITVDRLEDLKVTGHTARP